MFLSTVFLSSLTFVILSLILDEWLLQKRAALRFLLIIIMNSSSRVLPIGVIKLLKKSAVNHLLLPRDGHRPCAELLEEFLIFVIKLDTFDFREVADVICVPGVDNVGLGHPGRVNQPCLQTGEVNGFEPLMLSWVFIPERQSQVF